MPNYAQYIIAHRGASWLAPENTLASVRLGFELGADAVEVDVHLSADNRIMVNHDKDTKRTAGGKNYTIRETPSNILRKLDVGSWKDDKFKHERIPFLEEVLAEVPDGKKLIIEVKANTEILPYLQSVINESGIKDQLVIISFGKDVIIEAKRLMPEIPAYWLLHSFKDYSIEEAIEIAKVNQLEGLNVNFRLVDASFMERMKGAELEVYVYTVNDPKKAESLAKSGVKGITTDRPKWLKDQIKAL